jgi:hypothetical protein
MLKRFHLTRRSHEARRSRAAGALNAMPVGVVRSFANRRSNSDVLEYSYVKDYHVSGVIYGAHNEGYRKLPYCYVLIKGKGHVAMVDVGYNNKDYGAVMATTFGVEHWPFA